MPSLMSRTPSRSPRADGEATRTRILQTAGELFARDGYAATPNKAIAAHAGVDLASINYHFGSRAGLYQAVLIEAHHRMMDANTLQRLAQSTLPPEEKLYRLIDWIVPGHPGHPGQQDAAAAWPLAVLANEVLAPSPHMETLYQSAVVPKVAHVLDILSQISGIDRQDPALLRCAVSVIAPCLLLVLSQRGLPSPARVVLQQPRADVVDHLHRFALAGLRKVSSSK